MIRQQFDFISKTFWLQASASGGLVKWKGHEGSLMISISYLLYMHKTYITMYYVYECRYTFFLVIGWATSQTNVEEKY